MTISWLDIKICFNLAIYQKKKKKKKEKKKKKICKKKKKKKKAKKKKTKLVRTKKITDFFDHLVVEYIVG